MSRQPPRPDSGLYQDWKSWANALLRYLSLVEEESALSAGTQVKTYASTDVPSAEQAGQIIYQTDTLKMSASFNSVWNDFAFLSVANTWTETQTLNGTAVLVINSTFTTAIDLHGGTQNSGGQGLWLGEGKTIAFDNGPFRELFYSGGSLVFQILGVTKFAFSVGNDANDGNYSIQGNKVLGTRKTGWTIDTGTDKRTANATYSGTASAGYVQAELQAAMDALRDATQTIKALKDDLHATAGHGLIGT